MKCGAQRRPGTPTSPTLPREIPMHLQAVLSDAHTRPLFEAAARHGALPVAWLRGVHELARGGDVLVVVHDLSPDPERTLDALQALARGGPTAIFLLLPPSGAVLRAA